MTIRLQSIYATGRGGDVICVHEFDVIKFLWDMLAERDPVVNISHREMPRMDEHVNFVLNQPYKDWWLVQKEMPRETVIVGQCYLTKQLEIGLHIARAHQRKGFGRDTLRLLTERYAGQELLANISPNNHASAKLFAEFGFTHVQNTYRRDAE